MAAGDINQTVPVQIMHVFLVLCYSTQIGWVEQHTRKTCGVVWLSSPAVLCTLMKQFISLLHGINIKVQQTLPHPEGVIIFRNSK